MSFSLLVDHHYTVSHRAFPKETYGFWGRGGEWNARWLLIPLTLEKNGWCSHVVLPSNDSITVQGKKKAGTQKKRHKAFCLLSGQAHSFLGHPVYPFVNFLHVLGWTMTLLFFATLCSLPFLFFRFFLFSLFFFTFLLSSPNPFPSLVLFPSHFLLLLLLPPPPPPSPHLTSPLSIIIVLVAQLNSKQPRQRPFFLHT